MARRLRQNFATIAVWQPADSARSAGLRYTTDAKPGIRRKRRGRSFTYLGPDGRVIRSAAELVRIKSLVIPPAWTAWGTRKPSAGKATSTRRSSSPTRTDR